MLFIGENDNEIYAGVVGLSIGLGVMMMWPDPKVYYDED